MKEKAYDVQTEKLVAGALNTFGITPKNCYYDDLRCEAYLIYVECKKNHDGNKSKFTTYFFNQVKYKLSQFRRENSYNWAQTELSLDISDEDGKYINLFVADVDIENELINKSELKKTEFIPQLFENLKEYELDIIKKVFWENLSLSEIGKIYNKSKQAIQQMLKRVLDKLKIEIDKMGEVI